MRKIFVIGTVLCTAVLVLSGCAGGAGLGCDRYGCNGSAGANVGPIGGSFGAGVDRHGAGVGAGVHVGGVGLSFGGDVE